MDYQENVVQMNSSLLDKSITNLCKSDWNWCCLWVNSKGKVKADSCFGHKNYYICERREYAKQKRFKDDKLSL